MISHAIKWYIKIRKYDGLELMLRYSTHVFMDALMVFNEYTDGFCGVKMGQMDIPKQAKF